MGLGKSHAIHCVSFLESISEIQFGMVYRGFKQVQSQARATIRGVHKYGKEPNRRCVQFSLKRIRANMFCVFQSNQTSGTFKYHDKDSVGNQINFQSPLPV